MAAERAVVIAERTAAQIQGTHFDAASALAGSTEDFEFAREGQSTRVNLRTDMEPKRVGQIMAPLARPLLERQVLSGLERRARLRTGIPPPRQCYVA